MNYSIDPAALRSVIPLPLEAVKNNLKLASAVQLRVLLFCFCDTSAEISAKAVSKGLGISEDEVSDALLFWAQNGVLKSSEPQAEEKSECSKPARTHTPSPDELPTREDVARRGNEDEKIRLLLQEAQLKFGRNLKTNESRILVWLFDDRGMDLSVLLLLLHYAASEGKLRISFIEKTAIAWLEAGVESVADAEEQIAAKAREQLSWKVVRSVFGIDRIIPSKREQEYSTLWIDNWNLSAELLRAAYDICADNTGKISFPYIAKILKKWHEDGVKSPSDIDSAKDRAENGDGGLSDAAGYDIEAFESMLDNDD